MFEQWIDLYRGPDENLSLELSALLTQHDIPYKSDSFQPDSKMAAYGAEAGGYGGGIGGALRRAPFANAGLVGAALETEEDLERIYRVRIRKQDFARVQVLRSNADLGGN